MRPLLLVPVLLAYLSHFACGNFEKDHAKVIIIGAGASGISAAQVLFEKQVDFVILEAEPRVGGRIQSIDWSKNRKMELGASWVPGASENEFWDKMKHLKGGIIDDSYSYIVDYDGAKGSEVPSQLSAPILDQFRTAFQNCKMTSKTLNEKVKDTPAAFFDLDVSISECLEQQGYPKEEYSSDTEHRIADLIRWAGIDLRFATDSNDVSLLGSYTEFEFGLSPARYMVADERGFSSFLDAMAEPFHDKVFVNTKAVSVYQNETKKEVCVTTSHSDSFCGDYVISTLPLGTLKQETVQFYPKLSHKKLTAINEMVVSALAKVCVEFDDKFWPKELMMMAEKTTGKFGWAISLDEPKYFLDSGTICFMLTGDEARRVEAVEDKIKLRPEIEAWVQVMFPEVYPRPTITNLAVSDWSGSPHFHGAISVWPMGLTPEEFRQLGIREGRVFFAGEHTHSDFHGTITGGLLSGQETAMNLVNMLTRRATPLTPPPPDDDTPDPSSDTTNPHHHHHHNSHIHPANLPDPEDPNPHTATSTPAPTTPWYRERAARFTLIGVALLCAGPAIVAFISAFSGDGGEYRESLDLDRVRLESIYSTLSGVADERNPLFRQQQKTRRGKKRRGRGGGRRETIESVNSEGMDAESDEEGSEENENSSSSYETDEEEEEGSKGATGFFRKLF